MLRRERLSDNVQNRIEHISTLRDQKEEFINLILYGPCIILQYICNPTRYTIFDD